MGQIIGEGITFDDVLLVPSYSKVIPNQVDLTTWLTKRIKLNIPMMSYMECRDGYGNGASDGDCNGASGGNRHYT